MKLEQIKIGETYLVKPDRKLTVTAVQRAERRLLANGGLGEIGRCMVVGVDGSGRVMVDLVGRYEMTWAEHEEKRAAAADVRRRRAKAKAMVNEAFGAAGVKPVSVGLGIDASVVDIRVRSSDIPTLLALLVLAKVAEEALDETVSIPEL